MSSTELQFPPIQISVDEVGGFTFASLADLQSFTQSAREFEVIFSAGGVAPQYIANLAGNLTALKSLTSEFERTLGQFRPEMNEVQRKQLSARIVEEQDRLRGVIQTAYRRSPKALWLSSTPESKFVLELAKANADEATAAFLHLRGADFEMRTASTRRGVFKAQLFSAGVTNLRGDAETASIREVTEKWRSDANRMKADMESAISTSKAQNDAHANAVAAEKQQADERAVEFTKFVAAKDSEARSVRDAAQAELKTVVETYDQHMKLQAPVAYWRAKKERHLSERRTLENWTISVGLGSFAILGLYVFDYFHASPAGTIPWSEILGFFVLSSLVFWSVKILVRLLLSAIHLAEDAAEREVMAMTYMALVRGDGTSTKYLEEKDRALVLAPLFRPSATGVIDDGAPPHLSELFAKIGNR